MAEAKGVDFPDREDYIGLFWWKVNYYYVGEDGAKVEARIDVIAIDIAACKDLIEDGGASGLEYIDSDLIGTALDFYDTQLTDNFD